MANVEEVWNDPDFQGLPAAEKQKVLLELDPDFGALPAEEQAKVVGADPTAPSSQPVEQSQPSGMGGAVINAVKDIGSTMIGDPTQFAKPITAQESNPLKAALLKLSQPVAGITGPSQLSATISEPGRRAGEGVTEGLNSLAQNLNQGQEPSKLVKGVNSVIGTADSMALDPQNFVMEGLARPVVNAGAAAVNKLGKEAAALGSAVSGVKLRDIKKLFESPMDVITALSSKEAGGKLGAAKKAAGVTREEEFLISKAGDRAVGGARSVAEDLRPLFEADPQKVTMGQLIALRRAAGKLASEAKGSEKALWAPVLNSVTEHIASRSATVAKAIGDYAASATKESFTRLVPRGASGKPDFFRTIGALTTGLATSPAAIGLATLAAKMGASAVKPLAKASTSKPVRNTGLAVLRRYLENQVQGR